MLKTILSTVAAIAVTAGAASAQTGATASDLSGMSWDEIVAQAKQEGQMTWYVWYYQDDFRNAVEAFEKKYGIDVTIPEGTAAGNSDKMLAERNREIGDIDAFSWGWGEFQTLDQPATFAALGDILPEDDGRKTDIGGVDFNGYVLPYWGNQTGIAYDPAKISGDDLPQTPEEFAAFWKANPGKFGFNYENGGSGPAFYQAMLRNEADVDFNDGEVTDAKLEALKPGFDLFNEDAQDYVITASNADNIIRISDGELWMAPAWEDHLASLQKSNEVRDDIKLYIPEMGMQGGGNGVAIPLNAPHPAAAAVFINWLTSPETQTMFNKTFGTAPMNANSDDSAALLPNSQRAFSVPATAQPFGDAVKEAFVDNVILER